MMTQSELLQTLLGGLVATIALTTTEALARGFGLTRINVSFMLGSMLSGDRDRAAVLGFGLHFVTGWIFALLYVGIMRTLSLPWWTAPVLGLGHALFVLAALMPVLPALHPRMASETHGPTPTRQLQPPGFLALNYGRRTALVEIAAHIVFGAVVGWFALAMS